MFGFNRFLLRFDARFRLVFNTRLSTVALSRFRLFDNYGFFLFNGFFFRLLRLGFTSVFSLRFLLGFLTVELAEIGVSAPQNGLGFAFETYSHTVGIFNSTADIYAHFGHGFHRLFLLDFLIIFKQIFTDVYRVIDGAFFAVYYVFSGFLVARFTLLHFCLTGIFSLGLLLGFFGFKVAQIGVSAP